MHRLKAPGGMDTPSTVDYDRPSSIMGRRRHGWFRRPTGSGEALDGRLARPTTAGPGVRSCQCARASGLRPHIGQHAWRRATEAAARSLRDRRVRPWPHRQSQDHLAFPNRAAGSHAARSQ
jgi:hypothetical protein